MSNSQSFSRRSLLAGALAAPFAALARAKKEIPIGLELYSVRGDLKKDLSSTVDYVAKMGYQCVEFYSPYYDWSPEQAKQVRKQLDDLGIRCYSTHNSSAALKPDGIQKAIDLNHTLGAHYVVLAHPGKVEGIDGWKGVADLLNSANSTMSPHGLHTGYHNHDLEWKPTDGKLPLELLASQTDKSVMMQLDVGTCLESGNDPVAWIDKHPGRIRSMHLKDWSPEKGYKVLLGEGSGQWKKIFDAAESTGGVEYYLIEQEGSQYSEKETAERCLAAFKQIHG